jgi:ATP-dependent Clp protease ATP-binding subunit ClpA
VVARIVDKFVAELQAQLAEKRVTLTLSAEARGWLADRGFDPRMGARPMARIIQSEVKKPLAEKILFGELLGGGSVRVEVDQDGTKLVLVATPAEAPPRPEPVEH